MKVTLKVTKKHIDDGVPCITDACPVALAYKSLGFRDVCIGGGSDNVLVKGRARYAVILPERVNTFIDKFDLSERVKPFSITTTLLPLA